MTKEVCYALWGNNEVQWSFVASEGELGGMLCLWDTQNFEVTSCFIGEGYIGLEGIWCEKEVVVINVYAFCQRRSGCRGWEGLKRRRQNYIIKRWFLVGDFNCVISPNEKEGEGDLDYGRAEWEEFNDFIVSLICIDMR